MLFLISARSIVSSIPQTILFWAMRTFIHAIPMCSDVQFRTNSAPFLCVTSTFSSHLQESEEWIRELPIPHYVNLSISDHNDDEQRMPWSHTPSGPPLDVDSAFCMIKKTFESVIVRPVLALSCSSRVESQLSITSATLRAIFIESRAGCI
ncbi:hypothetical protein F5146DRAFT_1067943, partial [Armillaria mellea]